MESSVEVLQEVKKQQYRLQVTSWAVVYSARLVVAYWMKEVFREV